MKTNDLCNDSKRSRYKRVDMLMKTYRLLWEILFFNQNIRKFSKKSYGSPGSF